MAEETATIPTVSIDVANEIEKPRLACLLFFDYFNETGSLKLNLLGVFDRILIESETKTSPPFGIFVRTGQTFDSEVLVRIFDPKGTPVGGFGFISARPDAENTKAFQAQAIASIRFTATVEGVYWVDVSYKEQSLGGTGLMVEFRKAEGDKNEHTRGDA